VVLLVQLDLDLRAPLAQLALLAVAVAVRRQVLLNLIVLPITMMRQVES
jgi:hypothetical protein